MSQLGVETIGPDQGETLFCWLFAIANSIFSSMWAKLGMSTLFCLRSYTFQEKSQLMKLKDCCTKRILLVLFVVKYALVLFRKLSNVSSQKLDLLLSQLFKNCFQLVKTNIIFLRMRSMFLGMRGFCVTRASLLLSQFNNSTKLYNKSRKGLP